MLEAAAKHMYESARYGPLQTQERAIRYGRRRVDPNKGKGIFRYETGRYKLRFNKMTGKYEYKNTLLKLLFVNPTGQYPILNILIS